MVLDLLRLVAERGRSDRALTPFGWLTGSTVVVVVGDVFGGITIGW